MQKTTPTASARAPPKTVDNSTSLTVETTLVFLRLRQVFTEATILYHFDPDRYIGIETNTSSYDIGGILSRLNSESC